MSEPVLRESEIHDDLRANEVREWQLWSLTLGLLVVFGSGAVAGFYMLLNTQLGEGNARQAAYRLLGGLAVLIVLFCMHVLHVRVGGAAPDTASPLTTSGQGAGHSVRAGLSPGATHRDPLLRQPHGS